MKHFISVLFSSICTVTTAHSDVIITNPVAKDVGQSYGFYTGQQLSLTRISKEFPSLSGLAFKAGEEFLAKFGDSIREMDATMTNLNPKKWKKIKAGVEHQIAERMASIPLTHTDAVQFIQGVLDRAEGDLPSPVLETLLIFKPMYQRNPGAELTDGYKKLYENSGTGKAKGVVFSLEVPISWKKMEGKRPNIAVKFVSENGRGLEIFLVLIKAFPVELGESISAADIAEFLKSTEIADLLPGGATYLSSGKLTLETLPGFWVRFDLNATRGRHSANMSTMMYTIFYRNRMIQMQGQVAARAKESNVPKDRLASFNALFDLIANSLVLPQIYD